MAGSLPLKNDVQLVTQFPQSRRQALDVLSAAESVLPIADSEVTCGPMTRPATLNSSATSSSNSTDFSSSSSRELWMQIINLKLVFRFLEARCHGNLFMLALSIELSSGDIRQMALAYGKRSTDVAGRRRLVTQPGGLTLYPTSTLCPKNIQILFFNNTVKNYVILMIFGTLNPEKNLK